MRSVSYEIVVIGVGNERALLSFARFHSRVELIIMYNSQALSSIDFATLAIYHAPEIFLQNIDQIQEIVFSELGISAFEVLNEYNVAPLNCRRDISMIGFIHRIVISEAPFQFSKFINVACDTSSTRGSAYNFDKHNL